MRKGILTAVAVSLLHTCAAVAQSPLPFPNDQPPPPPPAGPPVPVRVDGPYGNPGSQPPGPDTLPTPSPSPYPPPPPPPSAPRQTVVVPVDPIYQPSGAVPLRFNTAPPEGGGTAWATVDFLVWWVKGGPSPNPLVSAGSVIDALPGALGQPGTTVLFGGNNIDFGTVPGGRFNFGFWLPQCPIVGFEAGFFGIGQNRVHFNAYSDANGDQIIGRPIFDAQTQTETFYGDSYPGYATGGVTITATTELESWEVSAALNLAKTHSWSLDVTAGFRSLNLEETINISDTATPLTPGVFVFQGVPVFPSGTLTDFDQFRTSNTFYGGQVGTRFYWYTGPVDLALNAKVALGVTQQVTTIEGASSLLYPGAPPITVPGGILAQATNIGRYYQSQFSVVPEAGINLGYRLTPWMHITLGYTFLYWSDVARPGDQIDRTVNSSQVPTSNNYGVLTGPISPVLTTPQTTNFWAQGLNFGLEFRF